MQVLKVVFQGEKNCRRHVHSIRVDNVRHTEADARQAEQDLLNTQECLRMLVKPAKERQKMLGQKLQDANVCSTQTMESYTKVDEWLRSTEAFLKRSEENVQQARRIARLAVEALGSPSVAG